MALIPKHKRRKWDAKSQEAILVGYEEHTKAYRLYDPVKRNVFRSRDVIFISEVGGNSEMQAETQAINPVRQRMKTYVSLEYDPEPTADDDQVHPEEDPADEISDDEESTLDETDDETESEMEFYSQVETSGGEDSNQDSTDDSTNVTIIALPPRQNSNPPESRVVLRRSGRERVIPGKYNDYILPNNCFAFQHPTDQPDAASESQPGVPGTSGVQQGLKASRCLPQRSADPRTLAEAMRSPDAIKWQAAMDEEYQALMDNGTWELVQLPPNKKAVGCKWLYKTKVDEKGATVRHKARIVAQGFTQKYGSDYDEVFAPVAKQVTFRTLLTIASQRKSIVKHVDVKTAYLNGELEETIYMRQPEGYATGDDRTVCRLRRSLYGLKQSARVWNRKVDSVFKAMGFQQSKMDPCLYIRRKKGKTSYILIYVDDMVIVTQTEEEFTSILEALQANFTISNLGDIRHFLGIEVEKTDAGYKLNQEVYIRKLVERFNMQTAKPSKTPLDPGYLQHKEEMDQLPNNKDYMSLIGGLLYVAVQTRPDIAVSTSILAQKSSCPNQQDWNEAKRILRYLHTTRNLKLHLGSTNEGLQMFVDADWAGNYRDRKSNSGHLLLFGGGVIAWGSRKQSCVALSSTEAEFVALAEGCQELCWTRRLLEEIGGAAQSRTVVFEDNQSCIKLVESDKIERRSKHIETKYFFVRDLQEKGVIDLRYCPTEEMLADVLTKPLQRVRLEKLRWELGLRPDLSEEECRNI